MVGRLPLSTEILQNNWPLEIYIQSCDLLLQLFYSYLK